MNVKILRIAIDELVEALIIQRKAAQLPSMHQGWRFNFDKHIRRLAYAKAYVLVCEDTPDIIEGCMIFQMQNNKVPYMAYLEVAPHNFGSTKQYDFVAGSLIAFACSQSLLEGKDEYNGVLYFDVREASPSDQYKLMEQYRKKYYARQLSDTKMYIGGEDRKSLIKEYLERIVPNRDQENI